MLRVRSLPGIAFHTETQPSVDLPRMDVAGFVGFAERGPVHTPVQIEDIVQFENIFGGTYPLAWDEETATMQTACLVPAVNVFFEQGGRRCWVVRVASNSATTNRFPLLGLLQTSTSGYEQVYAEARSVGSWSDNLHVGVELLLDTLTVPAFGIAPQNRLDLSIIPQRGTPIVPGDMLQVDFADGIHRTYVVVAQEDIVSDEGFLHILSGPERTHWFRRVNADSFVDGLEIESIPAYCPQVDEKGMLDLDNSLLTLPAEGDVPDGARNEALYIPTDQWLCLDTDRGRMWALTGKSSADRIELVALWLEGADFEQTPVNVQSAPRVQRVRLALHARDAVGNHRTLPDLACAPPQPRYAGYLPCDEELYKPHYATLPDPNDPWVLLWEEVQHPRFPLNLKPCTRDVEKNEEGAILIPLGLETGSKWSTAVHNDKKRLVRDGLVPNTGDHGELSGEEWARFTEDLFLDDRLRYAEQRSLIELAIDLIYVQGETLRGIHALLPLEEISMVALPDAAQRGWLPAEAKETETETESVSTVEVCAREGPFVTKSEEPGAENDGDDAPETVILSEIPKEDHWTLIPSLGYEDDGLLQVQIRAVMMAAARADMVMVLGMPKHYRSKESLQHQRQLETELLRAGEMANSYAALYHPWIITREENGTLLHTHPAGAVCGVMAARSIARGAWVAPANEIVHSALAVMPAVQVDEAFFSVGINLIWQIANGFTVWGAHTQSTDVNLGQLNVRRLLILLRRMALNEGQEYLFAPNGPEFRRRIKQQWEQVLARLFRQGAFAGSTPTEAFRVVVDETINTASSVEQGRLIVELRVAPSHPLSFITVRLIEANGGVLAVQEGTGNGR